MNSQEPRINATDVLEHLDWVRGLARSLVRDASLADDITQETWLAAFRKPAASGVSKGWLAQVVRNAVRQENRRTAIRSEHEERARQKNETASTEDLVDRVHVQRMVVDAVLALDAPYQCVILLRYFEGLAPRDIARCQGAPVATVKTRLRRGLEQLREALDKHNGGDRAAWLSAVTAFAAPVGSSLGTGTLGAGTLVLGGIAMATMMKVSAAALVAAACVYFVVRTPPAESRGTATALPRSAAEELADAGRVGTELVSATEEPATEAGRRSLAREEPPGAASAVLERNVLRVILEGITEEDARLATVTLMGLDKRDGWPTKIGDSWPCQGLTSEFDLDPVLASLHGLESLRSGELEVAVELPHHLGGRAGVSLERGVELANGKTVHEVRMRPVHPEFWPEFTLAVRDAHTRAHLEGVELRIRSGPNMAVWGRNQLGKLQGDGLRSPIALMGGREPNESEDTVAGVALSPAAGESPRLVELARRRTPERGVTVSARAPGYAWGSTAIDVSQGERELLLEPATTMVVRLSNVQLERYAALETVPMLCIYWIREDGGNSSVHYEPLGETLETEGLRLDSLVPGGYRVAVELGGGSWTQQPVLALEELILAAGETRELVLALEDPPAAPERATLGGVISFPAPTATWSEEKVRLQLYFQPTQKWRQPDVEFALADLKRVGGMLPTWSFRVANLPVGMYRVQLMPFLKVWMIDLQAGGREDLELVLPELAEVVVETVDGWTGERVPRSDLYYRRLEPLPGQVQNDLAKADTEEPGRFRFWAAPGAVRVWPKWPNGAEREYGGNGEEFELVPGFQSVKFEFTPVNAMRFEFREDGTALPTGPQGLETIQDIRAVDHEGRVTDGGLQRDMVVEVSAPGLYEISFEGIDKDRYHPIPPRLVDVRAGETAEVFVELHRK